MYRINGKTAFGGIAIGKLKEFTKAAQDVCKKSIEDVEKEIHRFENGKKQAIEELQGLYQKAVKEAGESSAAIFEVHAMMLEDKDFTATVIDTIASEKANAEYAVSVAADKFAAMFVSLEDEYMKERAADVSDIAGRLIAILSGKSTNELPDAKDGEPFIVLADDLAPSETLQLDRSRVLAFVTRGGSVNSHTAILARTMNIPAIVSAKVETGLNGRLAIVDGEQGMLIVEPEEELLEEYRSKLREIEKRQERLLKWKGKKTVTAKGRPVSLYANIGGVNDAKAALENDAEGIGLFRSEFLYLEKNTYPTEEEQFEAYKAVAELMGDKKVIIRTLDIGADKKIDYFNLDKEENPALGYRAIRICLDRPEIFRTQIRAIYRASAFGNISIMLPMITSLWEVQKARELITDAKGELEKEQLPVGKPELGIMIETPAAVMIASELAAEVDFFSIGTNDLTQYTLAADRQNVKLEAFYDTHHPAIMKMIQMVVESAHNAGIWAGVCGELGADLDVTEELINMGVDELSVSPSRILPVRERIGNIE